MSDAQGTAELKFATDFRVRPEDMNAMDSTDLT
jgi:hypothetical protein